MSLKPSGEWATGSVIWNPNMRPPSSFPWRLFRWFVGQQLALVVGLFSIYYFIEWMRIDSLAQPEVREAQLSMLQRSLGFGLSLAVLVSLLMGRRLVVPLGRLIDRAKRLRKFPFAKEQLTDDELREEEEGEWYDLERALNKLGRDYRNKTIRLSREKTELRAIMTAVGEAVLAVNRACDPLFYNNQFALYFRLQGWDGRKVGIGEIIRYPEVIEGYRRTIESGQVTTQENAMILPGETQVRSFRITYHPLRKKHNGEVYGVAGVFLDQTEARSAEKLRIDFVANASHELKTPVTSLKGYVQTLKEDLNAGRTEDVLKFVEVIDRNVTRLSDLISDLLDLSQLESGRQMHQQVASTRELTERVLQQLDTRQHEVHVDCRVNEVVGDPTRIEQVLRNLLQNAVRYVPSGKRIEVLWESGREGRPCLRVKDNGPGIPEIHLNRVFERFYRVDGGRSRDKGGTGIGLSLVKHIMQSHGGSVSVASELGQGTEFTCQF